MTFLEAGSRLLSLASNAAEGNAEAAVSLSGADFVAEKILSRFLPIVTENTAESE
jgi:hypothetical protein